LISVASVAGLLEVAEREMADEEEQLRESLKNHPHLTLDELREFKELFNLVRACVRVPEPSGAGHSAFAISPASLRPPARTVWI